MLCQGVGKGAGFCQSETDKRLFHFWASFLQELSLTWLLSCKIGFCLLYFSDGCCLWMAVKKKIFLEASNLMCTHLIVLALSISIYTSLLCYSKITADVISTTPSLGAFIWMQGISLQSHWLFISSLPLKTLFYGWSSGVNFPVEIFVGIALKHFSGHFDWRYWMALDF